MGGLYITPNSTEMGWKRRGLRVSSEALLCLGVATIVASFVVDVNADGSKPNIWILIGGVIMIMAAAIGWSLTFCLIWETIQSDNNGSDQNPKAPIHSIQVVCPEADLNNKLDPTYLTAKYVSESKPDSKEKRKNRSDNSKSRSKDDDRRKNKNKQTSSKTSSKNSSKNSSGSSSKTSKNNKTSGSHSNSKSSRSSDYSRSTATTNTNSSSYTATSSSYDSSSYTSSEQRKSYV